MTLLQPFSALVLWISLMMVLSSVNTDKPEENRYSCPVIQCSAPAVNGLPGRDGRDGPKGEKGDPDPQKAEYPASIVSMKRCHFEFGASFVSCIQNSKVDYFSEQGEGLRGLQGFPGKAGPPGMKGDVGPRGEKGQKGEQGIVASDGLQRQVTALETKLKVLEDELNRYKNALILKNIRSIGKKMFVSTGNQDTFENGKSLCARAGSTLASPRNDAENTALKDLVRPARQAHIGISDAQTEGRFVYLSGGAVTYSKWNTGEPNNLRNEDCVVIHESGKWNDVDCSSTQALIICEFSS